AGRQPRRQGARPDRAGRDRHLVVFRLLPRRARRARRGAALRRGRARGETGTELSPAVSHRDRADAEGFARQQDRYRHARGGGPAPRHHDPRRAGGELDAHRRRKHRRCRLFGAVEDQARGERGRKLSVQHPAARRHGEGGGGKRHARGDRPLNPAADPDRGAAEYRKRRARPDAKGPRQLRGGRPDHAGPAAEGRSALAGDRCFPRRAGRPRRQRAGAERSADLRQQGGARSARARRADHPERRSLSRADGGGGQGRYVPSPQVSRQKKKGPGGPPPAHVSGNDGAVVRRHRQDHHGSGRRGRSLSAARPAHAAAEDAAADRRQPMRLNLVGGLVAVLIIVALVIAYGALFSVYQTRQGLVGRLGPPGRVIVEPGLNYKIPLIDSVINIDKRILDLENPAQEVIASDQKRLVVDAFARYRIKDVLKFYQTVGTVEGANSQLSILLNSALRRVLGEATLTQVVRDQREHLMARVREQLDNEAQAFGIGVVDVRIRRADLPEENSQAVYQRMQTERQQEAAQYRAEGAQRAQEIRAKADRDVTVLLAEAQSKGERTRGEGDAERNRIFADAYGRDPDFFSFYRSM